ncbi:tonB dependent receptor family protein [Burkholderia thailandensis MSMB121]|uniref:TonB-dependent receptor n=1 Tax=Burkholderia humptydooensis TaxID=430531 RepID=UPI00032802F7|nr:TonB-dependent receptor [Burkholderia humptydooensis]AGK50580.1 tonB dependent receptor family protein [Burkholderia thailandensis MSMB121]ATF34054.1 TonB-dependent receptor [Burkholderia thailandensis]KST72569.1 TonB-dependent receptor [Burkholderia humptydooensis]
MLPLSLALAAALAPTPSAHAAETATPAAARPSTAASSDPADGSQLEAVTITARRHSESQQKVPVSVTVVSGADLAVDAAPSVGNAGLARSVPNLAFADIGATYANVFSIRGVGSFMPLAADDESVVTYVNDVPRATTGAPPTFMDVDRVEALRGPQGTLFGRNTQGGAINVITKQPTFKREFSATAEAGTHGRWLGEVIGNGAVSNDVAARVAVRMSNLNGNVPNLATGGADGRVKIGAARGTVLWVPDDRTSVTVSGFVDQTETTAPRFVMLQNPDFPQVELNPSTYSRWRDAGGSVRVDREFERVRLTSLTSYQDSRNVQQFDLTDGLIYSALSKRPATAFDVPGADYTEMHFGETTFQQEVRVSSRDDSPVMWTAGLNYFHSRFTNDTSAVASPAAFNFVTTQNGQQHNRINTDSVSLFGEASWPLTARLKAITGVRATCERKDARYAFDGNGNPKVVSRFREEGSLSDTFVTGRAGLTFDWTDTLMTYATVSRGEASAGFPAVTVNGPQGRRESSFPASTSWTYELGFKSLWLDRRLSVDGSVFYNDVKNGHLVAFFPSNGLFMPASLDYRTYGAELELGAKVSRYVRLTAGLGYTQGELRSVPAGDVTGARSGNRLPNVPRTTANLGVHGELPGGAVGMPGRFNADAAWQFVGSRAVDVRNSFNLAAYSVVNLRVGWTYRNWTLYGFAENLLDRRYVVAGQSWAPGVGSVRVGQPRVVGIGITTQL